MVKKQVPDSKPRIIFWNIYLLFNFSLHLKFLSRTLCQTGKDDIVNFEGIWGKYRGNSKNVSKQWLEEKGLETSPFSLHQEKLSFLMCRNFLLSTGALISHPDGGSKLHEE